MNNVPPIIEQALAPFAPPRFIPSEPGIYLDLPMADYLAIKAFSSGVGQVLLYECPAKAHFESPFNPDREPDDTKETDTGSIAHAILLEQSEAGVVIVDPEDHMGPRGGVPKGWTNDSIRAVREAARSSGKIPVLLDDMAEIRLMVAAGERYIASLRDSEPAVYSMFQPTGGTSEVTMLWREGETLCKLRTDRMASDYSLVCDYKTSARCVEPDSWGRTQLTGLGYYFGAAFYRRGIKAVTGATPNYIFLAQEKERPYLCSLNGCNASMLALGAEKVEASLSLWKRCMKSGSWPAYPARVCYPELPAWEAARWQEKIGNDAQGIPYDIATLFGKVQP